jgi:hypothetical protein
MRWSVLTTKALIAFSATRGLWRRGVCLELDYRRTITVSHGGETQEAQEGGLSLAHLLVVAAFAFTPTLRLSRVELSHYGGPHGGVVRCKRHKRFQCRGVRESASSRFAIPSNQAHAPRQSRDGLKAPEISTPDRHRTATVAPEFQGARPCPRQNYHSQQPRPSRSLAASAAMK